MRFNLETNEEIVRISYGAEKIQTKQYIRTPHSLLLQMMVTTDNKQRGDLPHHQPRVLARQSLHIQQGLHC